MFHDDNCQRIFYILLSDFLSETDPAAPIEKTTFLSGLLKVSSSFQFSAIDSGKELRASVEVFIKWAEAEKKFEIWMSSIDKNVTISISHIDAIKICSDLMKHNGLRAFSVVKKFKGIMIKSGIIITDNKYMAAIKDFYERFQNDILAYLSSYICEFLNNIRWAIHGYLRPEFNRSYHILDPELSHYNYKIPEIIKCEYARDCYWELMNILRRKPLMKKFIVSEGFKCEY